MHIIFDALPAVVAFLIISLLTLIGYGIKQLYHFAQDMKHIIEKEMTNGKPAGEGESSKDVLLGIREAIQLHDEWARGDAVRIAKILREHNEKLDQMKTTAQEVIDDL